MMLRVLIFVLLLVLLWPAVEYLFRTHHSLAYGWETLIGLHDDRVFDKKDLSPLERQFNWEIQAGDWLEVNLRSNTMIIRRKDNSEFSETFHIGSGLDQDENIAWAGETYNPKTPADTWIIKEKNQQNLYGTFGTMEKDKEGNTIPEQLFLRMYRADSDGNLYQTKYGFHTTPEIEDILTNRNGYGSFGCLLSRYQLLKFMEEMYEQQITQGKEGLVVKTFWEEKSDQLASYTSP